MRPSLKKTLMTLTILSAGFMVLYPCAVEAAGFKKPKVKEATVNKDFEQYPKFGEAKAEVNVALDLHKTAADLLGNKKVLEEHKAAIEKYNEIERRLKQSENCNKALFNEYFANGTTVWNNVAAWAEDTASVLLAEASNSFGDTTEVNQQLKAAEQGDVVSSGGNSEYSSVNADTTEAEVKAMTKKGEKKADTYKSDFDDSADDMVAFGKIRWDIGAKALQDIYANPASWGTQKKKFAPWVDQKHAYDVYLDKRYAQMEKAYQPIPPQGYPVRPKMATSASYLPEDMYNTDIPSTGDTAKTTADKTWCGANECARVNKGSLFSAHQQYVQALQKLPLAPGSTTPDLTAPFLPKAPLPPWRETVYILNVEKQIPAIANLPQPWALVTTSIDYFAPNGELANLVEKHGNTVRFRPGDYDKETGEIKLDKNGNPRIAIPLSANRISSYLTLMSARDEQLPIKDRAIASIKEMNENMIAVLAKAGYDIPNPENFDLANASDYNKAMNVLKDLQNQRIKTAQTKIAGLRSEYSGDLMPSVQKMLSEEEKTMAALQKDSEFVVNVSRDNAEQINTLIMNAVADAIANQTYKDNMAEDNEDASALPAVGCPVL